jgi:hypothetical protein
MCRFANVPRADGSEGPSFTKVCDGQGNMNACLLCPSSLTYWKLTHAGPVADPWNGTGERTMTEPEPQVHHEINSKEAGWYAVGPHSAEPCTLCLKPTTMRSPKHTPCHKTCAERWNAGERIFARPR